MVMLHCKSLKEIRVWTPAENRVGNSSGPARKLFCQQHARVILTHVVENDVNVCKRISSLFSCGFFIAMAWNKAGSKNQVSYM